MKLKTIGMKEANSIGVSRIVRDAEESPLVVLRRNGVDVAMVLPLTLRGLENVRKAFLQALADPSKLKDNPDVLAALQVVFGKGWGMIEKKVSENLSEGPGNAGEQPGSAGQGGVTRRRRKVSK